MASPAYLWYPKDVLSSGRVESLSAEEECWYRRALDRSWLDEGIPFDPVTCARYIGKGCTPDAAVKILDIFFESKKKDESKMVNARQEKERKLFFKKRKQKSEAGKQGMRNRWKQKTSSDNSVITKDNIPTSIPIPNKEKEKEGEAAPPPTTKKDEASNPLHHPAVLLFESKFLFTPTQAFAREVASRVSDLTVWDALIADKIDYAAKPINERRRITGWLLSAYAERMERKPKRLPTVDEVLRDRAEGMRPENRILPPAEPIRPVIQPNYNRS